MTEKELKTQVNRLRDAVHRLHDRYEYTASGKLREKVDPQVVRYIATIDQEIDNLSLYLITKPVDLRRRKSE